MTDQPQQEIPKGFTRIAVPSNCVFYPKGIDSVYARRLDLIDISDLGTSKNSGDLPKFIETIVATTNLPAHLMTQDDFQAVMYWHRLNSFPKKPLTLKWECDNPKHLEAASLTILEGMDEDTRDMIDDAKRFLVNRKTVQRSDLKIHEITRERFDATVAWLRSERQTKEFVFMPPTVSDTIEFVKITQMQLRNQKLDELAVTDENYAQVVEAILDSSKDETIVEVASMLSRTHGVTLSDRIAFLRSKVLEARDNGDNLFDSTFLYEVREYKNLTDHSISEIIPDKCKFRGCEQAVNLTVEFDPFEFFPDI